MTIVILAMFIVVMTTLGQLLLKFAATKSLYSYRKLFLIGSGYAVFGVTVIISYYLMKIIDLKYFTVIMSLNYISVMVVSHFVLHEPMTMRKTAGTILVAFGVYLFLC